MKDAVLALTSTTKGRGGGGASNVAGGSKKDEPYIIVITMRVDRYHSVFSEAEVDLSKAAKMILAEEDYINFFATCGPSYVRAIHRAQEVTALFSFNASSKVAAQEFATALQLFVGGNSLKADYAESKQRRSEKLEKNSNGRICDGADGAACYSDSFFNALSLDIKNSLNIRIFSYGIGLHSNGMDTFVSTSLDDFNRIMETTYTAMTTRAAGSKFSEGKVVDIEVVPWIDNPQFQILAEFHDHQLWMPIPHSLIENSMERNGTLACPSSHMIVDDFGKCCNSDDLVYSQYAQTDGSKFQKSICEPFQFVSHQVMRDNLAVNGEFVVRMDSAVRQYDEVFSILDHCVRALRQVPTKYDYHFLQVRSTPVPPLLRDISMKSRYTVKELRMALDPFNDSELVHIVGKQRDEYFEMFYQRCVTALQGMNLGNNKLTDPLYFMAHPWYNLEECLHLSCLEVNKMWDRLNGQGCIDGILHYKAPPESQPKLSRDDPHCAKVIDPVSGKEVCKFVPDFDFVRKLGQCRSRLPGTEDGRGRLVPISLEYIARQFCEPNLSLDHPQADEKRISEIELAWAACSGEMDDRMSITVDLLGDCATSRLPTAICGEDRNKAIQWFLGDKFSNEDSFYLVSTSFSLFRCHDLQSLLPSPLMLSSLNYLSFRKNAWSWEFYFLALLKMENIKNFDVKVKTGAHQPIIAIGTGCIVKTTKWDL